MKSHSTFTAKITVLMGDAGNTGAGSNQNRERTSIMADFKVAQISKKFLAAAIGAAAAVAIILAASTKTPSVGIAAAMPAFAETGGLSLEMGRLTDFLQVIMIKNGSTKNYSRVYVDCGFFHGSELIAAGGSSVDHLAAGSTGFTNVIAGIPADRAECRIVEGRTK